MSSPVPASSKRKAHDSSAGADDDEDGTSVTEPHAKRLHLNVGETEQKQSDEIWVTVFGRRLQLDMKEFDKALELEVVEDLNALLDFIAENRRDVNSNNEVYYDRLGELGNYVYGLYFRRRMESGDHKDHTLVKGVLRALCTELEAECRKMQMKFLPSTDFLRAVLDRKMGIATEFQSGRDAHAYSEKVQKYDQMLARPHQDRTTLSGEYKPFSP